MNAPNETLAQNQSRLWREACAERDALRAENARLRDALEFILNDADPGEAAVLSVAGYNKACAALAQRR